jgi:hypothetical protein
MQQPLEEAVPQHREWFEKASAAFAQFDMPEWMVWGPPWLLPHLYQKVTDDKFRADAANQAKADLEAKLKKARREWMEDVKAGLITLDEAQKRTAAMKARHEDKLQWESGQVEEDRAASIGDVTQDGEVNLEEEEPVPTKTGVKVSPSYFFKPRYSR